MNKFIKLISIIIISLSVYIIYNKTNNSCYKITNIGDKLSLGVDNNIIEKGYIDYYKDYIKQEKKKVIIDNSYSNKSQTLNNTLLLIRNNSEIKRKIIESNLIIITLGYNDLIYSINTEEKKDPKTMKKIIKEINNDYNMLINEINKYYHKDILVIGYYKNYNDDFINKGVVELNKILEKNKNIYYIDTYNTLNNREKYFNNLNSYYPNSRGHFEITKKIISKTLEIS